MYPNETSYLLDIIHNTDHAKLCVISVKLRSAQYSGKMKRRLALWVVKIDEKQM